MAGQPPRDSIDQLQAARAAQVRFERVRMAHLPWGFSRASPRDEVVGRLVLLGDEGEEWRPPPDRPPVREARSELLASLEEAAARLPGDAWIAGQLVFYHVEAGRPAEALAVARGCRAERWWCDALAGYSLHAGGDFAAAETTFEAALAGMPPAERARWLEIEHLLDGEAATAYRRTDGAERDDFRRRFWWLADPLWSLPGNDRRSEHFSRQVLDRVLEDARTPFEMSWGDDLREVLVRYGWPTGWERIRARTWALGSGGGDAGVVGHDPPGERRFAPGGELLAEPYERGFFRGDLEEEGARSTYAPAYAERFLDLDHQIAVFRRGESARVVAGWKVPAESLAGAERVEAALAVSTGPDRTPLLVRAAGRRTSGAHDLTVPWEPAMVSVEALVREAGLAGRARLGLPLAGTAGSRPALSDLLLIGPAEPLPVSLEEAVERARGTTRVDPSEPVGVFWELYPPGGGPYAVRMSIRLRDEGGGFWKGLGSLLGLADRSAGSVALEWEETVPARAAVQPRALVLALPDLPPGAYALELEAVLPDSRRARAERAIVVE